ncbi:MULTISPECIES: PTS fructose subfamily transporter subunit IIA [Clostridium]|uniref:PTS system fructose subfamily transporter subunit IIA n=2 Tax=root TaxID=1 RepID=R9CFE6_9CLOT|nr:MULTISPECIES: PTS fructose subfamily transporter subunit IIA [Clostridium]EOR27745.1 PTS system fructose subfamily transporter subunit IIA [Clostridium sartagoforme AAU1]KLE16296.1 PTS fructose transporter subunit IIA [Clostridium sp. C8]
MNQIILASHGELAKGMKDTLNMIIGNTESIKVFSSYRDEETSIRDLIEEVIIENYDINKIYILTDIFGGSVNNEIMDLMKKYSKINLISGMNLPLVISIATTDNISDELLDEFIKDSQSAIINCNKLLNKFIDRKEEDL